MPIDGQLAHWTYVPGRLFSVNAATARALPNLFTRNERLNARFDTPAGAFALSMVGALFVGSLETVWSRSEEHTSELQSLMRISYAVFCLKKTNTRDSNYQNNTHSTMKNYCHKHEAHTQT